MDFGLRALRIVVAVLLLVPLLALASVAATDSRKPANGGPYLIGQFLVATQKLDDPRFVKTVIYMVEHNDSGAFGLIVNKRSTVPVLMSSLLNELGIAAVNDDYEVRLHYGGPVDPGRLFVLHSGEYMSPGTTPVDDTISLTPRRSVFEAFAAGAGPKRALFALGYAGWGPGQLEGEIARGDWLSAPATEPVIFDDDNDSKWERASDGAGLKL